MTQEQFAQLLGCEPYPAGGAEITAVTEHSRRVSPGAVFVASKGTHADGHDFAEAAVEAGAVAIIGDRPGLTELHDVPYYPMAQPRKALGIVAQALAGNCSSEMTVIGVTGTNGKSSVVALVEDQEATLKTLNRTSNAIELIAANPAYETRLYGADRVRVQGTLVGLLRSY